MKSTRVDADIYAPCALGATINDETLKQLKCKVIAGSANNQLANPKHDKMVKDMGILYAPDYVINAGGVIHVCSEAANMSWKKRTNVFATSTTLWISCLRVLKKKIVRPENWLMKWRAKSSLKPKSKHTHKKRAG